MKLVCNYCKDGSVFDTPDELRRHCRSRHSQRNDSDILAGSRTGDEAAAAALLASQVTAGVMEATSQVGSGGGGDGGQVELEVGQPCARCNRRVHIMDEAHFARCEDAPDANESTMVMFSGHLSMSTRTPELPVEPAPDPCAHCGEDRSLSLRRRRESALWRREVRRHGTRSFLLVPCPEREALRAKGGVVKRQDLRRMVDLLLKGSKDEEFSLLFARQRNEKFSR